MSAFRAVAAKASLRELRFALCQTGSASAGTREFIMTNYKALKAVNPTLPMLIRECAGAEARLTARYELGREEVVSLEGMTAAGVAKQLEALLAKAK